MIAKQIRFFANRHNLLGLRRFAKNPNQQSEREFAPNRVLLALSKLYTKNHKPRALLRQAASTNSHSPYFPRTHLDNKVCSSLAVPPRGPVHAAKVPK